jgi:hypothetical protein
MGCTRSKLLQDAGDDLLFLRKLPQSARMNRVSGTVSRLRNLGQDQFDNEEHLSGLHLTISNDSDRFELTTDTNGAFELAGVKPGTYRVTLV